MTPFGQVVNVVWQTAEHSMALVEALE